MADSSNPDEYFGRPRSDYQFSLREFMFAMLCLSVVLGLGSRWLLWSREQSRRMTCGNNLKQLGLALHNYHDTFLAFPQPNGYAGGLPHSWRIHIHPFYESSRLYEQYDYRFAWNSPMNHRLTYGRNQHGRCPSDTTVGIDSRTYLAVVGPRAPFQPGRTLSLSDFHDGIATTAWLTEVHRSDISWTEPRDLPFDEFVIWLKPDHRPSLLGNHELGTMVGFADGHVQLIPSGTRLAQWQALFTIAGNDNAQLGRLGLATGESDLPQETPKP